MQNSSFLHLNLLKGHGCKYTDLFRIGLKNRIIKTTFPPLCERFRHTRRLYSRIERNKGRSSYKRDGFLWIRDNPISSRHRLRISSAAYPSTTIRHTYSTPPRIVLRESVRRWAFRWDWAAPGQWLPARNLRRHPIALYNLGITRPHPTCSRHLERVHRLVGRPPRVPVAERPDRNTCRRIDGTSHVLSGIGRSPESVLRSEDCSHIESPRVKNIDQMPFADPRSMIRKQGHTLPCKPGIIHRRIGRTDPYGLRRNRADRIRQ